jgi:outer membrane protein assembly factor BamE (lipoprotein component of BamABCDE complex)
MQQNRAQETPETRTNRRILKRKKCNKTEHKELQKHVLTAAFQTGKTCKKTEHNKLMQKQVLPAVFRTGKKCKKTEHKTLQKRLLPAVFPRG